MRSPAHDAFVEDVGAYLLSALSEEEAEAFAAHLADCPPCREELEHLRPAAETLPRSVEPVSPPPRLGAALMSRVRDEARGPNPARRTQGRSVVRWRPRLSLRPVAALAATLAALALAGVGGYTLAERLQAPAERTVVARVDNLRAPNGRGKLVIPADRRDVAYLRVQGLPPLSRGRVYEVWVKRGREVVPQSLFTVSSGGTGTAGVNDGLEGVDSVLVTEEGEGGSRTPTRAPMLIVEPS